MSSGGELVFGLHAVLAALQQNPDEVSGVWLDRSRHDPRLQKILRAAQQAGVTVERVERRVLDQMAGGQRHQGAVARAASAPVQGEEGLARRLEALAEPALFLVLDGVTDPHNLGACLRSADGAGAHGVIVPKDRASGLTPVVRKVASGAAQSMPFFQVTNLARTLDWLKEQGVWVVGADGAAPGSLFEVDLRGAVALVLGAEGEGLRRLTRERCDMLARLPMRGTVESLNVSVAAGICLFEARRQRG